MSNSDSLETGYVAPEDRALNRTGLKGNFKSHLKVFSDHNGFVKGELHTLIGTKGSGKSTWSRTMLTDLVYQEKKVFLYLSEENKIKYLSGLNDLFLEYAKTEDRLREIMDNIVVMSELSEGPETRDSIMKKITEVVEYCSIEIIIFDNFTTSFLSELNISVQSETLRQFKRMAVANDIPVIMFFHTGKLADPKRLDGDNVRGSATAVNIGSYNYLVTQFMDGTTLRNFIYTEKARYHSLANKKMYELTYSHKDGIFTGCVDYYLEDYMELLGGGKRSRKGF
jgi:hypothetical protein